MYREPGGSIEADAYIYGPSSGFHPAFARHEKQLSTPGCAENVVTVGSFDWNDRFSRFGQTVYLRSVIDNEPIKVGRASLYSSPGPLRIGDVTKPDILAPGQWHIAPVPLNIDAVRDTTGYYQSFNGTSAATPYVSGIIALMFEANPKLTLGEIRVLLKECASSDPITQAVPNSKWGNGRLDIQAVDRLFARLNQR
jgi:subtilisin family serine protease